MNEAFSRRSPRAIGLTLEAAARLLYARLRLSTLHFEKRVVQADAGAGSDAALRDARFVAHAVAAASVRAPMQLTCVHRSLALWWMLRARGIHAELRIGLQRDSTPLAAHAWVTCAGEALNETPDSVARYRAFTDAVVPRH